MTTLVNARTSAATAAVFPAHSAHGLAAAPGNYQVNNDNDAQRNRPVRLLGNARRRVRHAVHEAQRLTQMRQRARGLVQHVAIVPFSNDELTEMLGAHVNSITNSVSTLRKAECVERQRGALVITDFKKLKSVAENLIVKK